jgi:vacuolar-type H+-ATPase subunit H
MLEVLQDVLAAEKRAEELLEKAREEVNRKRTEFSEEESRQVREAEAEADKLVRERLAAVREEQGQRVAEATESFTAGEKRFETDGHPRLDETVERAVRLVLGGEARPEHRAEEDG